jgi:hypothetical protein
MAVNVLCATKQNLVQTPIPWIYTLSGALTLFFIFNITKFGSSHLYQVCYSSVYYTETIAIHLSINYESDDSSHQYQVCKVFFLSKSKTIWFSSEQLNYINSRIWFRLLNGCNITKLQVQMETLCHHRSIWNRGGRRTIVQLGCFTGKNQILAIGADEDLIFTWRPAGVFTRIEAPKICMRALNWSLGASFLGWAGDALSAHDRMEARSYGHGRRRRELVAGSALSRVVTCLLCWAHREVGDGAMAAVAS